MHKYHGSRHCRLRKGGSSYPCPTASAPYSEVGAQCIQPMTGRSNGRDREPQGSPHVVRVLLSFVVDDG